MPLETENLKLKKPLQEEYYDVDISNSNLDIIDKAIGDRVIKVTGKGLSTNDYTTAEKEKLATLNNYDDSGLRQELSEKTGINATATYTNNAVTITAPVSVQKITFIAPSDFSESDTYTLNGTQITITDLNNEPLSNAWKQGSPVQLTIKGNQGFFKSGGGDSKLNIFAQPTQPPINEGIWLQTNDKFKNVQVANNVVNAGDWNYGNPYFNAPNTVMTKMGCTAIGDKIYCIGGKTGGPLVSDTQKWVLKYDLSNNNWYHCSSLLNDRNSFGCVSHDNKIYCMGGVNGNEILKTLHIFDVVSNSWEVGPEMPVERYGFGCVFLNGKIYCMGGNDSSYKKIYEIDVYDVSIKKWSRISSTLPLVQGTMRCVAKGDKIYCVGANYSSSKIQIYDTKLDRWEVKDEFYTMANDFSCVIIDDKIYCVGGVYSGKYSSSLDVYNISSGEWEVLENMPTPRADMGCVAVGKTFYCVCGYIDNIKGTNFIESYDVVEKHWSKNISLRQRKFLSNSVLYNNKIYTFGGKGESSGDSGEIDIVECYDLSTNSWTQKTKSPKKFLGFGCVLHKGKVYCIGGVALGEVSSEMFVYDLESDTWSSSQIPFTRTYLACAIVNDVIYCIGGYSKSESEAKNVWGFDLNSKLWSIKGTLPVATRGLSCVSNSNIIFCIGGESLDGQTPLNNVQIYDTVAKKWSVGLGMPTPRFYFGCSLIGSKIYCIGGNNAQGVSGVVEVYDYKENKWANFTPMKIFATGPAMCNSNDAIFCLGGKNVGNVYMSDGQTLSLVPTKFPESTLVLQNAFDGKNKYYTQLINSKQLFGDRLLTGFENAWIYVNEKLKEYPAYYGDGEKWNKFKN